MASYIEKYKGTEVERLARKIFMDILPNIHLIGVFIVSMTVVYRSKALFSIIVTFTSSAVSSSNSSA